MRSQSIVGQFCSPAHLSVHLLFEDFKPQNIKEILFHRIYHSKKNHPFISMFQLDCLSCYLRNLITIQQGAKSLQSKAAKSSGKTGNTASYRSINNTKMSLGKPG